MVAGTKNDNFYRLLTKVNSERIIGINKLVSFIDTKLDYFNTPASSNRHSAFRGGLVSHSVIVTHELLSLKNLLRSEISDESCVIVGLFHDLGKLGTIDRPIYKEAYSGGYELNSTNYPVKLNVPMRSLEIISRFIPLTTWESQAIIGHDGQYVAANEDLAMRETPLTLLLHFADVWSTRFIEEHYNTPDEKWLP